LLRLPVKRFPARRLSRQRRATSGDPVKQPGRLQVLGVRADERIRLFRGIADTASPTEVDRDYAAFLSPPTSIQRVRYHTLQLLAKASG
jgi:hypothetical protein